MTLTATLVRIESEGVNYTVGRQELAQSGHLMNPSNDLVFHDTENHTNVMCCSSLSTGMKE